MKLNNRYSLHTQLWEGAYMVEVGLGFGDFASHLLEAVPNLDLTSVESWRGRFMKRRMIDCKPEVMERMLKYLDGYTYKILEMDSTAASETFEDESLDCVYIDAGHDYRNVINDLNVWYPKLKRGGIFSGHDYKKVGVAGVRTAVNEFFKAYALKLGVTEDVNPNPSWYTIKS